MSYTPERFRERLRQREMWALGKERDEQLDAHLVAASKVEALTKVNLHLQAEIDRLNTPPEVERFRAALREIRRICADGPSSDGRVNFCLNAAVRALGKSG